jgi:opacity protein-like surface antigen
VLRRLLVIAVLACVLAPPAAAVAQNPFGPLPQAQQETQADTTTTGSSSSNSNDEGGGLRTWQQVLIFMGGVVLIVGIGYAIVTDARRNAPVKEGEESHIGQPTKALPKARTKPVRRAKARQARAARKRNR